MPTRRVELSPVERIELLERDLERVERDLATVALTCANIERVTMASDLVEFQRAIGSLQDDVRTIELALKSLDIETRASFARYDAKECQG